ncbi:MAG: ATP-dependent DNA helicase RecG, partial [Anaerovoracaceae bacterium]
MMVSELKGVGAKKTEYLAKLRVRTCMDLLYLFPASYQDRRKPVSLSQVEPGKPVVTGGCLQWARNDGIPRRGKRILHIGVEDSGVFMEVIFFNSAFLTGKFRTGETYYFYGTPTEKGGRLQLIHPEILDPREEDGWGIVPIYPLTAGLSQKELRKLQRMALEKLAPFEEYLPEGIIAENQLPSLDFALQQIHFPQTMEALKQARFRLIFDELFVLQLGLLMMKEKGKRGIGFTKDAVEEEYIGRMPYPLTDAQRRVIGEIMADMEGESPMNRLLQGDVGSGKTAVAEVALYKAAKSGYQGVFMAPTDLLAAQHFGSLRESFAPLGVKVGYLSGQMTAGQKRETLKELKEGTIDILIGTHALIQPGVVFHKLGLVITDEQHRFGVKQRASLFEKGNNPDVLVMSATPIPRTLAVILYGDMEVSIIDQLPPGRKSIKTKAVTGRSREKVYGFLAEELAKGRQAYVVAPLIEESETLDLRSATEIYEELNSRFSAGTVALLHGEMKQKEKEAIMKGFHEGKYKVLVATVVIEVGINVPN